MNRHIKVESQTKMKTCTKRKLIHTACTASVSIMIRDNVAIVTHAIH